MATLDRNNTHLDQILWVRSCVLLLAQHESFAWIKCAFLSGNGLRFLSSPFPRSAYWAALHSSAVAASRHHDERIGAGGTVHLFRVNQETELGLRNRVLREGWTMEESDSDPERLLSLLKEAGTSVDKALTPGPVRVSDTKRFTSPSNLKLVAGIYAAAFEKRIEVLPYGADAK